MFHTLLRRSRVGALRLTLRLPATTMILAAVSLAACNDPADGAIDRERFVQTYVDLRATALQTDSQRLADPERDAILARNGVTAEDLLHFAEAHADDLDFMRDVWNDIELRLDVPPDPR